MQKKGMDELQRLSKEDFRLSKKTPVVVVLENVRSMNNVGSIFRTSDAFLIEKICLCGFTPKPPHREINKTALGATESVAWAGYDDAGDTITELKESGYKVYAVEQVHDSMMLQDFQVMPGEKIALVFGNEAEGVSEGLIAQCTGSIEIPQFGSKHSFNISVAAGIVLWEIYKKQMG
jgi:tRNA G18 (ribose-2'-O)-methylase SpoU